PDGSPNGTDFHLDHGGFQGNLNLYPSIKLVRLRNGNVLAAYMNASATNAQFYGQIINHNGNSSPKLLDSTSGSYNFDIAEALTGEIILADGYNQNPLKLNSISSSLTTQANIVDSTAVVNTINGMGAFANNNVLTVWVDNNARLHGCIFTAAGAI